MFNTDKRANFMQSYTYTSIRLKFDTSQVFFESSLCIGYCTYIFSFSSDKQHQLRSSLLLHSKYKKVKFSNCLAAEHLVVDHFSFLASIDFLICCVYLLLLCV